MSDTNPLPEDNYSEAAVEENPDADLFDEIPPDDVIDDDAQMICPHCMAPNEPLADFCHACGAPLSSLAAIDPWKQVFVQGWWYRQAAKQSGSSFGLRGKILLFALLVFAVPSVLAESLSSWSIFRHVSPSMIRIVLSTAIVAICLVYLFRVLIRRLDDQVEDQGDRDLNSPD